MKRFIVLFIICLLVCGTSVLAEEEVPGLSEEDLEIWVQVGDSGGDVRLVLEMAHNLGFLETLPKNEEEYREAYVPAVEQLEKALSLEADGAVRLYELEAIDGLIYPGQARTEAKKLLERLANLGYISELPDQPTVYEQKYVNAVKKAEKQLKLTVDGYITAKEWQVIASQKTIRPDDLKTLTITSKEGKAVLKWSSSKNAVRYIVKRGSAEVARVKGTTWTDTNVNQDDYYTYYVVPVRYDIQGTGKTEGVYIEPVYKKVSAAELGKNRYSYQDKFVDLSKTKVSYTRVDGSDYRITLTAKANGSSYTIILVLTNYKDWLPEISKHKLTAAAARGKVTKVSGSTITIEVHYVSYWYQ